MQHAPADDRGHLSGLGVCRSAPRNMRSTLAIACRVPLHAAPRSVDNCWLRSRAPGLSETQTGYGRVEFLTSRRKVEEEVGS